MSVSQGKQYWRRQAEQLLATDMPVREWCELNHVNRASMYSWLSTFADEEPELFGGKENIVDRNRRRWVESTRNNMRNAKAMTVSHSSPGFLMIDTESLVADEISPESVPTPPSPITVTIKGIEVAIPAHTDKSDIDHVLKAVTSL